MSQHPNFIRARWEAILGTTGLFCLLIAGVEIYFQPHGVFTHVITGLGIVLCAIAQFFLSPRGNQMKGQSVDITEGGRLPELKNARRGDYAPKSNTEVQRNTLLIFLPPGFLFLFAAFRIHQTIGYWLLGIPGIGLTMGAFWPLIKRGMGQKLRQSRPPSSPPPT